VSQRGCEASRVVNHDRAVLPLEPVDHESGLSFEMPKGIHLVGVYHYDNEMDVPSFLNDMSDSDPVEHTCCSKTALHDSSESVGDHRKAWSLITIDIASAKDSFPPTS
jgi:hypothetical protein